MSACFLLRCPLNLLGKSATDDPKQVDEVLRLFSKHSITPDVTTYQHRLLSLERADNLESATQLLAEMYNQGIAPNRDCVRIVVLLAARLNMPVLAMELALNSKDTAGAMDDEVNMVILMSGAATLNVCTPT
jgi:hypothetical protein